MPSRQSCMCRIRVTGDNFGHYWWINHTQIADAIHLKTRIHDGWWIICRSHFACAHLNQIELQIINYKLNHMYEMGSVVSCCVAIYSFRLVLKHTWCCKLPACRRMQHSQYGSESNSKCSQPKNGRVLNRVCHLANAFVLAIFIHCERRWNLCFLECLLKLQEFI